MKNPFKKITQDVRVSTNLDTEKAGENARGNWNNQLDSILSCVGFTVGLGNLWRFPYLCMRNGGGAFLIPYFTFLFLCAMPLFYLELSIAQFSSSSPLLIWNMCPLFKGLGWGMLIVSTICTIYYNIIVTWILYYLGMSFAKELPWSTCGNPWNTPHCAHIVKVNATVFVSNGSDPVTPVNFGETSTGGTVNFSNITLIKGTPGEEFWHNQVLGLSDGIDEMGGLRWKLVICLIVAWIIVFLCLIKGVKSSGKVVYVTATVPYLFLTILLIRGVTLSGSMKGILWYVRPDWSRLLEFKVWGDACLQVFYSLGPAWGGLITMASYNKFTNNCRNDAIIVCLVCSGTSLYGGFVIFSIIGYMATRAGVEVPDVITAGPGLAFVAYPEALAQLPISPLWAVCFFLMLLTIGLDSMFVTLETLLTSLVDVWPGLLTKRKILFTVVVCLVQLLLGLPFVTRGGMYLFQIVDWYCASFSLMVIALCECVVLCYIYGLNRFCYDIGMMVGSQPGWYWKSLWAFITPLILLIVLIFTCFQMVDPTYGDYIYPRWAIGFGWLLAMCSIVPIPGVAIYLFAQQSGSITQRFTKLLTPSSDWGPSRPEHKALYKFSTFLSPKEKIPLTLVKQAEQKKTIATAEKVILTNEKHSGNSKESDAFL